MDHLDSETLSAYIDSELSPADMDAVGRHLASCEACRREARELLGMATLVRELPTYRPRETIEIDPGDRDRDSGPIPMLLDFARPVALAALIILVALAGLRLVTDRADEPDDGEQITFSESREAQDGTEAAGETSEEVTAPGAAAPDMAEAPSESDEEAAPASDAMMRQAVEAPTVVATAPPRAPPPEADDGNAFGLAEGLIVAVAVIVALAAAYRVRHRVPRRHRRA